MHRSRTRVTTAVLLFAISSLTLLITSQRAHAITANADAYTILYVHEDAFRNWDFSCGNGDSCISRTNVGWPVSLLFYNNAEINKVKDNILEPRYDWGDTCATHNYARMDDVAEWKWDGDAGKKTTCCPGSGPPNPTTADHIRFYAAGHSIHDMMYNTSWGYWIMASIHQDHNEPECLPIGSTWFGYGEIAEENLFDYWTGNLSRPAWIDYQFWNNTQNNDQANHYVRNDGYTSLFWVS